MEQAYERGEPTPMTTVILLLPGLGQTESVENVGTITLEIGQSE